MLPFKFPKLTKQFCLALVLSVSTCLALLTALQLKPASASASSTVPTSFAVGTIVEQCRGNFFGLVPWYAYIGNELDTGFDNGQHYTYRKCDVKCFNLTDQGKDAGGKPIQNACGQSASDVPLVLLAVIDDLLRVSGLVAVGFVLYGAFQYTASQGSPDGTAKAQSTIINALVGTVIAITATIFVSFLGRRLGN